MARLPDYRKEARTSLDEVLDSGRMSCAACGTSATPLNVYAATIQMTDSIDFVLGSDREKPSYTTSIAVCAVCGEHNIFVKRAFWLHEEGGDPETQVTWHKRLFPIGRATKKFPNTPAKHFKSYAAACRTLDVSPEASACMSRRCLQSVLSDQGHNQRDLAKQIDALLKANVLPTELHKCVDAIRTYGNFGAHPIDDTTTFQVIDVEPGEAEWCIEIAEQLMEHYFERPALIDAKIAAANAKLKAAGKAGIKS
jgi:Domain of unknown function (DUF4145)